MNDINKQRLSGTNKCKYNLFSLKDAIALFPSFKGATKQLVDMGVQMDVICAATEFRKPLLAQYRSLPCPGLFP